MKKIELLILGISIVVGVLSGYLTSKEKYFYLSSENPKMEITFDSYLNFFNQDRKYKEAYGSSKNTVVEMVYNTQNAILFGLTALGFLLIISYFFNLKRIEAKPSSTIRDVSLSAVSPHRDTAASS